jgi:hypothetical protein
MDPVAEARAAKGPLTSIAANISGRMYDIEELIADNQNIEALVAADMERFPNLQALYIPHNKIRRLDNLKTNYRLCFLDARDNQISEIDLSAQCYMRDLYLSGNRLEDLEKVLSKLAHMTDLQTLDLSGNPATLEKGYRSQVIAKFVTLKVLDGLDVPPGARAPPKKKDPALQSRPSSVLQYLLTRPPSAADAIVRCRADKIRKEREAKKKKEEEEQTAVARRRKEEFEEALKSRQLPLADFLVRGSKSQMNIGPPPRKEANFACKMFIKIPTYTENDGLADPEKIVAKQSPDLPTTALRRRMERKTVHPK